ncbi:PREDICTED: zinc finger protein 687-like [Priapulus caudatus]|uniref:Zinc finger protein 687-like n=1 Tax=Priapulus caudatus TaxID=37621 RepID=A0ABM1EG87_PRICU|nr:PREDICTED: zinc finger protein 687-like [Priapulus caudatus]
MAEEMDVIVKIEPGTDEYGGLYSAKQNVTGEAGLVLEAIKPSSDSLQPKITNVVSLSEIQNGLPTDNVSTNGQKKSVTYVNSKGDRVNVLVVNRSPSTSNLGQSPTSSSPALKRATARKSTSAPKNQTNGLKTTKTSGKAADGDELGASLTKYCFDVINRRHTKRYQPPADACDAAGRLFACMECGDTFLYERSLEQHARRVSMCITHLCVKCARTYQFYNRCSFIAHLRQHSLTVNTIDFGRVRIDAPSAKLARSCLSGLEPADSRADANAPTVPAKTSAVAASSGTPAQTVVTATSSGAPAGTVVAVTIGSGTQKTARDGAATTSSEVVVVGGVECTECLKRFATPAALGRHFAGPTASCRPSEVKVCAVCKHKMPPNACSLSAHVRIHRREPPFTCPECGVAVDAASWEAFLYHLRYQCCHYSRCVGYKCAACAASYNSSALLRSHVVSVHGESYLKCPTCPMAFKTHAGFEVHHAATHPSETLAMPRSIYKCPECDTVFHHNAQLQAHLQSHEARQSAATLRFIYKCLDCYKLFDTVELMAEHGKSHAHVVHNVCTLCGAVFETLADLCLHRYRAHRDSNAAANLPKPQPKTASSLRGNAAAAARGTPYPVCLACRVRAPDNQSLASHIRAAHGGARSMCMTCGGTFMSRSGMKLHGRRHRQDGRHICALCNNLPFPDADTLALHAGSAHFKPRACAGGPPQKGRGEGAVAAAAATPPAPAVKMKKFTAAELSEPSFSVAAASSSAAAGGTPERRVKVKKEEEEHAQEIHLLAKQRPYLCWLCREKNFPNRKLLQRHIVTRHGVVAADIRWEQLRLAEKRPLAVATAGRGVSHTTAKRLRVATGNGGDDDAYVCVKCEFATADAAAFREHIAQHREPASYQCAECGQCFVVAPALRRHLYFVHKVRRADADIEQEEEEAAGRRGAAGRREAREEEGEGPGGSSSLECSVCYRVFENVGALKTHIRSHGMAFIRSKRASP